MAPRLYDAKPAAQKDDPAKMESATMGRVRLPRLEDADQPQKKSKAKKAAKPKE